MFCETWEISRKKCIWDQYIDGYRRMPGIEQLVKCGFYRIVKEEITGVQHRILKEERTVLQKGY